VETQETKEHIYIKIKIKKPVSELEILGTSAQEVYSEYIFAVHKILYSIYPLGLRYEWAEDLKA
jgi:hypothetical protein